MRRILPEANPRNPKLADILRVYKKWEGRGIGMATLVNLCLENRIDVPYYRIYSEEVCLHLGASKLLSERMERLFSSFDRYIGERLDGASPSEEQKRVLAYLIKSEWINEKLGYTILLTPDNNHFTALRGLEKAGLIAADQGFHSARAISISRVPRLLAQGGARTVPPALLLSLKMHESGSGKLHSAPILCQK